MSNLKWCKIERGPSALEATWLSKNPVGLPSTIAGVYGNAHSAIIYPKLTLSCFAINPDLLIH
eukprot:12333722-Karenia_brevis.AAC.1